MADEPKIGEGHAAAWFRAGFKELGQALEAFPGQGIHHVEEPGLVGNPTQMAVSKETGVTSSYQDLLNSYIAQHPPGPEQDRGMER